MYLWRPETTKIIYAKDKGRIQSQHIQNSKVDINSPIRWHPAGSFAVIGTFKTLSHSFQSSLLISPSSVIFDFMHTCLGLLLNRINHYFHFTGQKPFTVDDECTLSSCYSNITPNRDKMVSYRYHLHIWLGSILQR